MTLRQSSLISLYFITAAIAYGRGHASSEIGIAHINVNSPKLHLIQLSDDIWYTNILTKINIHTPIQILLPNQMGMDVNSNLLATICATFPSINVAEVSRYYYNDTDGMALIRKYCNKKYENVIDVVAKKYYCLSATSALFHFISHYNIIFADQSLNVQYESKDDTLMIGKFEKKKKRQKTIIFHDFSSTRTADIQTAHRLELLYPLCNTRTRQSSLLSTLDYCVTNVGKRTLRAKILEPSCNADHLEQIHDSIDQLKHAIDVLVALESSLMRFSKVDRLLKLSLQSSAVSEFFIFHLRRHIVLNRKFIYFR